MLTAEKTEMRDADEKVVEIELERLKSFTNHSEYWNIGIGEQILRETEQEVLEAVKKLLIAVNDTIDEIYKFATIEIKAKAKAIESVMSQDGYVDLNFKIN